jgi:L-asparaginase II
MNHPVMIEVTRGGVVESRHIGAAAVLAADGRVEAAWGDVDVPVYARSAIKPLQAIPLVESGAAERFGLGDAEIALACASHNGEPRHVTTVRGWLARVGLSETDLECGGHAPLRLPAYAAMLRSGEEPTAAYNNCSGKHCGFLTTAVHLGEPTRGYIRPEHLVQQRLRVLYGELAGIDLTGAPAGTDGCGIPTLGVPLRAMARAMARMADPGGLAPARAAAIRRIQAAMWAEPFMVAGTDRFCSRINTLLPRRAAVKTGAEGVFCAMLPGLGLGVALKIHDGAGRAAEVALAVILRRLGVLDGTGTDELLQPPVRNVVGLAVGEMRPAAAWIAAAS